ncbi:AaceriAGR334Wp [[Ashbya] aceris (nom. inval.)]|nr:AaceriAGR334Wp [[Ashbya] aceris (nom. inval.)]
MSQAGEFMVPSGLMNNAGTWPACDSTILGVPTSNCKYVTTTSKLGDGNFSVVKECMNLQTKVRYAMKLIPKRLVRGRLQLIQREVMVLKHVRTRTHHLESGRGEHEKGVERQGTFDGHHHVLQLFDYFETKDNIVLVTQLCEQSDLYDRIINSGSLDIDTQVKPYIACLLSALDFLHQSGVIHRDIKAENILFRLRETLPPSDAKYDVRAHDLIIADFGLAVGKEDHSSLKEYVGTLSYLAPELVRCKDMKTMTPAEAERIPEYGAAVDIWALGVLCYFMMSGYMPFDCEDDAETSDCILKGDYYVDEEARANANESYKSCWNFMQRCFTMDDKIRPRANELMGHAFMREYFQSAAANDFASIPLLERSRSSNSLHHLAPPSRAPFISSGVPVINERPVPRVGSRERNLDKLRDTLRKTLSLTSLEPMRFVAQANAPNANKKNSTFVLEPAPPTGSLMNGCFSVTPESKSNLNTPVLSRRSSGQSVIDTATTTMRSYSAKGQRSKLLSSNGADTDRHRVPQFHFGDDDE